MNKNSLRKEIKERLSSMAASSRLEESLSLQSKIISSAEFKSADVVFLFSNLSDEPATDLIYRECLRQGKKVAYPLCLKDGNMEFYLINDFDTEMVSGSYGIMEPDVNLGTVVLAVPESFENSLIIVPGMAFDALGNRLGRGKGFYDRYLSCHKFSASIGFCFGCQMVDSVPIEPFDKPVDKVMPG